MSFKIRGSSITSTKLSMDSQIKKYVEMFMSNMSNTMNSVEFNNQKINDVVAITTKNIMIENNTEYIIPLETSQLFITMVAGGGSGGLGTIRNNFMYSGGGGGGGGGQMKLPVKLIRENKDDEIKLVCNIGKGGDSNNRDGGDTIIDIYRNNIFIETYKVTGGKAGGDGSLNEGGEPGIGINYIYNGCKGEKGSINLSSHVPLGGKGGSSVYFNGGKGMSYDIRETLCDGKYGGGAGGSIPHIERVNKGGDGIIILEYV